MKNRLIELQFFFIFLFFTNLIFTTKNVIYVVYEALIFFFFLVIYEALILIACLSWYILDILKYFIKSHLLIIFVLNFATLETFYNAFFLSWIISISNNVLEKYLTLSSQILIIYFTIRFYNIIILNFSVPIKMD